MGEGGGGGGGWRSVPQWISPGVSTLVSQSRPQVGSLSVVHCGFLRDAPGPKKEVQVTFMRSGSFVSPWLTCSLGGLGTGQGLHLTGRCLQPRVDGGRLRGPLERMTLCGG